MNSKKLSLPLIVKQMRADADRMTGHAGHYHEEQRIRRYADELEAALAQQAQPLTNEQHQALRIVADHCAGFLNARNIVYALLDAQQAQSLTDEMIEAEIDQRYVGSVSEAVIRPAIEGWRQAFRVGAKWARDRTAQQAQSRSRCQHCESDDIATGSFVRCFNCGITQNYDNA